MHSIEGYLRCLGLVSIPPGTVRKWCWLWPTVPLRHIGQEPCRMVHLGVPLAWDAGTS
jgi:hypothetical protein